MSEQTQPFPEQVLNSSVNLSSSPEVIGTVTPFEVISELATERSKQGYLAHIEEELHEDPVLSHINRAYDTIDAMNEGISASWKDGMPDDEQRAQNDRDETFIQRLRSRLTQVYGSDAVSQCRTLRHDRAELSKPYQSFFASGKTADDIFSDVLGRATNKDTAVRSLFVPEEPLIRSDGPGVILVSSPDTITEIPIGMFVSAIGFDSWNGRPEHIYKDGRPSRQVIEEYAALESAPPPINDLTGIALPDGRLVFVSGNSHRLAAQLRHPLRETVSFSVTSGS